MIQISHLNKSYNLNVQAVKDFKIQINPGEVFGLLGPNGAGKTTIIKILVGILKEDTGDILIEGKSKYGDYITYKKKFGYVSEEIKAYEKLTGIEFLNFIGDAYGLSKEIKRERLIEYIKFWGLEENIGDFIINYSHGMKQKLMIVAAVLHNPNILILDEPFVGLDPISLSLLKEFIRQYKESGKTVLISTHLLDIAEKICDRVCIINKGKTIYYGDLAMLNENKGLEDFFVSLIEKEREKGEL